MSTSRLTWLSIAVLVAVSLAACTGPDRVARPRRPAPKCPADPKLGVYDATRLEVRQQCLWFRGTVTDVAPRKDGDLHIDVEPDHGYGSYLNKGNEKDQDGAMVVEIMPGQSFPRPQPGEHLALFGTWVHDTHNDWNEIHPVWRIDYLDRGTSTTSLPPRTPLYTGDADD